MTVAVDTEELTSGTPPVEEQDDRGPLPLRGLAALAGSAEFAVWTSVNCFVC